MAVQSFQSAPDRGHLYVTHSIAPPMHNTIAASLSKPWEFSALECPTVQDMVDAFHSPTFIGAVITMPYKQTVIPHLSGIDPHTALIGAVNNVYLTPDHQLHGTNTDWEGFKGCLLSADLDGRGRGRPALVIGAGGASRAAVYALKMEFNCDTIYVVNRDDDEVAQLQSDTRAYSDDGDGDTTDSPRLIHATSAPQAQALPQPFYIIGTVPDMEARSASELAMLAVLDAFLNDSDGNNDSEAPPLPERGVVLDMCFKPRTTRTLKRAARAGWTCVEGTEVIGHQIVTQWALWTGEGPSAGLVDHIGAEHAWKVLRREARESSMINF